MDSYVWPVISKCDCAHILPLFQFAAVAGKKKKNFPDNLCSICRSSGERQVVMLQQEAEKRCLVDLN